MTNRLPHMGVAYQIAEERANWKTDPPGLTASIAAHTALDRLARNLALGLHPDTQPEFLARCGVAPERS